MTSRLDQSRGRRFFIDDLVNDLRPVRRYWSPRRRFGFWFAVQGSVVSVVMAMGPRSDLGAQMIRVPFVTELSTLAIVGLGTALLALHAAVPGQEPRRGLVYGLLAAAVAALALAAFLLPLAPLDWSLLDGTSCAGKTLMIAVLPWVALVVVVVRGAALDPPIAGLLAGMGPLTTAAVIMRLMCPVEERLHVVLWHDLPVLLGFGVSVTIGVTIIARWARRPLGEPRIPRA